MSRPPVHKRDAQTGQIACGAAHRPFSGHPCCRIDPAAVTCEECRNAAVAEVTDQIPPPHYSWQPPTPAAFTQRHLALYGAVD